MFLNFKVFFFLREKINCCHLIFEKLNRSIPEVFNSIKLLQSEL
jgi:hypothetical protein